MSRDISSIYKIRGNIMINYNETNDNLVLGNSTFNVDDVDISNCIAIGENAFALANPPISFTYDAMVIIGNNAMDSFVAGSEDLSDYTVVGYNSVGSLISADVESSGSTMIGSGAYSNATLTTNPVTCIGGSSNCGSGGSGTSVGYLALGSTTTSNSNTGIGHRSGDTITTGNQNTIIGSFADVNSTSSTDRIAIGYSAVATANGNVQLGQSTNVTDSVLSFRTQTVIQEAWRNSGSSYGFPSTNITTFPSSQQFIDNTGSMQRSDVEIYRVTSTTINATPSTLNVIPLTATEQIYDVNYKIIAIENSNNTESWWYHTVHIGNTSGNATVTPDLISQVGFTSPHTWTANTNHNEAAAITHCEVTITGEAATTIEWIIIAEVVRRDI